MFAIGLLAGGIKAEFESFGLTVILGSKDLTCRPTATETTEYD